MARVVIKSAHGSVNDGEFSVFVNEANGPIRRDIRRRANNVQQYQLRRVPRRTGRLAATSRKNEGSNGLRPFVEVLMGKQGQTDYLGYILFGTPAHVIRARPDRPNAALRFMSGGAVRFAREVRHPGTRPNNFVRDSIVQAAR
jgi:hypothetical protein